jgi:hypothetical protein
VSRGVTCLRGISPPLRFVAGRAYCIPEITATGDVLPFMHHFSIGFSSELQEADPDLIALPSTCGMLLTLRFRSARHEAVPPARPFGRHRRTVGALADFVEGTQTVLKPDTTHDSECRT